MLIDLTRYPLVLQPDECPSLIIVRTISDAGISGTVYQEAVDQGRGGYRRQGKATHEVHPTEQLTRGSATYMETKLPLHEAKEIASFAPVASVFEMASVLAHTVGKTVPGAWRVRVSVLYKADSRIWHVTAWDLARNATPIMTVSTRSLDPDSKVLGQATPLARAKRTIGADMPTNAWTRLLEDD